MAQASSQTQINWLEDRIRNLEERLNEVERYNKPIATPDVMRQARWMPIPKPLTDEAVGLLIGNSAVGLLIGNSVEGQLWLMSVVRAVERAHGIGEKE